LTIRVIDSVATVFPEPDSPTIQTVSPVVDEVDAVDGREGLRCRC